MRYTQKLYRLEIHRRRAKIAISKCVLEPMLKWILDFLLLVFLSVLYFFFRCRFSFWDRSFTYCTLRRTYINIRASPTKNSVLLYVNVVHSSTIWHSNGEEKTHAVAQKFMLTIIYINIKSNLRLLCSITFGASHITIYVYTRTRMNRWTGACVSCSVWNEYSCMCIHKLCMLWPVARCPPHTPFMNIGISLNIGFGCPKFDDVVMVMWWPEREWKRVHLFIYTQNTHTHTHTGT